VAATAATTIEGVSLLTEGHGGNGDVFDLDFSPDGIEVRRPGQATRLMSWDQVSDWTIEARRNGVLLTLRGRSSSVIRLVIPRWKSEDLDAVLREVTSHTATSTTTSEMAPEEGPAATTAPPERAGRLRRPASTTRSRAALHARGARRHTVSATWKVVVTIVLLAVLATAVTLVLLQSAGIISWGFLGPTA
jgi:hypothetical protein